MAKECGSVDYRTFTSAGFYFMHSSLCTYSTDIFIMEMHIIWGSLYRSIYFLFFLLSPLAVILFLHICTKHVLVSGAAREIESI